MNRKELNAYLKRGDIVIEGNIATWTLVSHGDISGTYRGVFKFKCFLTPTEKLAVGRLYRELLGNNSPALASVEEDNLAFTLSQLQYRVIAGPPFWGSAIGINGQIGDIPDKNVLGDIIDAAMIAELKYLAILQNKKEAIIKKAKNSAETLLAEKENETAIEASEDESKG